MPTPSVYPGVCIHLDHHPHPEQTPEYGAGTSLEEARAYLRTARPDALQCHVLGTFGYAAFPSKIAVPVPSLIGDPPGTWKEACDAEGVAFGVYCSTFGAGRAAPLGKYHVENRAGETLKQWVCPNKPYLDEFLIPFLLEVVERYQPAQFWLDGPNIPWNFKDECVCEACQRGYAKLYGRKLPLDPTAAQWEEVEEFSLWTNNTLIERVSEALPQAAPETAVAFNFAGFFPDGREMPSGADWLSADCLNDGDPHKAALHATFLASRGRKSDIMLYENVVRHDADGVDSYPRPMAQMKAEAASILAHGMRFHFWQDPEADGSMSAGKGPVASEMVSFARERVSWTVDNQSMAEIAIAYNNACRHDELRQRNRAIEAALRIFQQSHFPCDIVPDHVLLRELPRYRLVLFLEMSRMAEEVSTALRGFVEGGGVLLFVPGEHCGDVRWLRELAGEDSSLSVAPETQRSVATGGAALPFGGKQFTLEGDWQCLKPYRPGPDSPDSPEPWLAERRVGAGSLLCVTSQIFSDYAETAHPLLRDLVAEVVRAALDDEPQVELPLHPEIAVVMNRRDDDLYVHLVNRSHLAFGTPGQPSFLDRMPVQRNLEVTVRPPAAPERIELMPGHREVEWRAVGGRDYTVIVPELAYHTAVRLVGVLA